MSVSQPRIVIVADDLTGAADTALPFALAGFPTRVDLQPGTVLEQGVIALCTHTRHLSAEQTQQQNYSAIQKIVADGSNTIVYQKIDSTLRGHPAHALLGVMNGMNTDVALVAPAYPDQHRITVNGQQLVHGVPLEESDFKHEVHESRLPHIFGQCFDSITLLTPDNASTHLSKRGLFVADASTDDDLRKIVEAVLASKIPILCGSAGLAKALAETLSSDKSFKSQPDNKFTSGSILSVIGSRHPVSRRQVEFARSQGVKVIQAGANDLHESPTRIADMVCHQLENSASVILTTMDTQYQLTPEQVASGLGRIVSEVLSCQLVPHLVLSGGDTALAVGKALDATQIQLTTAIEAGIAVGHWLDGDAKDKVVVTKAGGFGSDSSLMNIIQVLSAS